MSKIPVIVRNFQDIHHFKRYHLLRLEAIHMGSQSASPFFCSFNGDNSTHTSVGTPLRLSYSHCKQSNEHGRDGSEDLHVGIDLENLGRWFSKSNWKNEFVMREL